MILRVLKDFLERKLEFVERGELRKRVAHVRDAAADGGDAFEVELRRAFDVEGGGEGVDVDVVHQGAVHDLAVMPDAAGVAGYLAAFHENIVAAGEFCRETEGLKGLRKEVRGDGADRPGEAVVEVLEVVVDGAATGDAASELDSVLAEIFEIHFLLRNLVMADDDRRLVAPESEHRFGRAALQQPLVERHVPPWVGARKVVEVHGVGAIMGAGRRATEAP